MLLLQRAASHFSVEIEEFALSQMPRIYLMSPEVLLLLDKGRTVTNRCGRTYLYRGGDLDASGRIGDFLDGDQILDAGEYQLTFEIEAFTRVVARSFLSR